MDGCNVPSKPMTTLRLIHAYLSHINNDKSGVAHQARKRHLIGNPAPSRQPVSRTTAGPEFLLRLTHHHDSRSAAGEKSSQTNGGDQACPTLVDTSQSRAGRTLTKPEQYCIQMLKAFDAEANDNQNFMISLIEHQRAVGMPLENYVPYGIIDLIDTRNSIGEKWRSVTEDASCSKWRTQVQNNICGAQ
jgi:hypothetical protein